MGAIAQKAAGAAAWALHAAMKMIAPVSGDLLVKLGLFAGMGLGAWMLLQRARQAVPSWANLPTPNWNAINPASSQNLVYQGTSGIVSAMVGYDETPGGLLFDVTHPDPMTMPGRPITMADAFATSPLMNGINYVIEAIPSPFTPKDSLQHTDDGHAYDLQGNRIY